MKGQRDGPSAEDGAGEEALQTTSLEASKVIEILDFQRGIAQQLKKDLESGFSRIRQLFQERKLFVLNEPALNCDALNDHLVPKSVLPIYDAELRKIYNSLYAELQQSVHRALTLYAQDIRQSDVTQDVLQILVYKVQLADQSIGELKDQNNYLLESNHGKHKTDFHTINMLKAQIYQAEKFGFVFRPDAVEKPQPNQADISDLQNTNHELLLEIYARDELITQFENRLEISLAEFEKLQLDFIAYKKATSDAASAAKRAESHEADYQPQPQIGQPETNNQEESAEETPKYHEIVEDYDEKPSHPSATLISMDNGSAPVAKVDLSVPMLAAAEPEIYLSRGVKVQLTDRQRFRQLIKAGDKHYLDMQTGIDYFKGARGLYGYVDVNGDFHYTTKDGLLVRIIQGSGDMFIIDEQGRQIVPATYARRYDRVYVRRNSFKYQIDQFGQKYCMRSEKRIDLDDNFAEVKLPFFRQFGFKMQLVAKCQMPEIPQAFVDQSGKIVVEERLQRRQDDDVSIYSTGDGIMYFRDEKGFYYFKDGEKCRRDKGGKAYVFRANFAFCDYDKGLFIGGRRYFFDEKFGYFFFLAEDGSRHVYDRTINCVIEDEMHYSVVSEMSIQDKIQRLQQKDASNLVKQREHVLPDAQLIGAHLQQARTRHPVENTVQSESCESDATSCDSEDDQQHDEPAAQEAEQQSQSATANSEKPKRRKNSKTTGKLNKQAEVESSRESSLKSSVQGFSSHESVLSNVKTNRKNYNLQANGSPYEKAPKQHFSEETRPSGQQAPGEYFKSVKPEKIAQPLSNEGVVSKTVSQSSQNNGTPSQIVQNAKTVREPLKPAENAKNDALDRATCETVDPTRRNTKRSSGGELSERNSLAKGETLKPRVHKKQEKHLETSVNSQEQRETDSEDDLYSSDEESTSYQAFVKQTHSPKQPKIRATKRHTAAARPEESEPSADSTESEDSCTDQVACGQDRTSDREPERKAREKKVFSSPEERRSERPSKNGAAPLDLSKYDREDVRDEVRNVCMAQADYSLALSGQDTEPKTQPEEAPKRTTERGKRREAALSAEDQRDAEYLRLLASTHLQAAHTSTKPAPEAALTASALVSSSGGKMSPLEQLMAECQNNDVGCQAGVSYFYKEKHQAIAARSKVMEEVIRVSQLMRSQVVSHTPQQVKKDCTKTVVTLDPFSVDFEYDPR